MKASVAFKQERRFNETCKTLRRRIAAKFRMHLICDLIKLNQISKVLLHGRFFENFIKSWKISLVTYKNMSKVQAVSTRECVFMKSFENSFDTWLVWSFLIS